MEKVSDIHNFWRWWSVQLALVSSVLAAITAAYVTLPADWLPHLPEWLRAGMAWATLITAGASAWARGVLQPKLQARDGEGG